MKILAIDPGYERLGVAVLEKTATHTDNTPRERLLFSECIQTDKSLPHAERLAIIVAELENILATYAPEALVIETLFFSKNQKTAMQVAEARGAIIATCARSGLSVVELSPADIKIAVTGHGASDKAAIMKMVPLLISIEKQITYDDEYDAIAAGLAFFAMQKNIHN